VTSTNELQLLARDHRIHFWRVGVDERDVCAHFRRRYELAVQSGAVADKHQRESAAGINLGRRVGVHSSEVNSLCSDRVRLERSERLRTHLIEKFNPHVVHSASEAQRSAALARRR
jgi:hypothetical protein